MRGWQSCCEAGERGAARAGGMYGLLCPVDCLLSSPCAVLLSSWICNTQPGAAACTLKATCADSVKHAPHLPVGHAAEVHIVLDVGLLGEGSLVLEPLGVHKVVQGDIWLHAMPAQHQVLIVFCSAPGHASCRHCAHSRLSDSLSSITACIAQDAVMQHCLPDVQACAASLQRLQWLVVHGAHVEQQRCTMQASCRGLHSGGGCVPDCRQDRWPHLCIQSMISW